MKELINNLNEQKAEKAFSNQSAIFDDLYSSNLIIQYKRQRVRDHVSKWLRPGSHILELNAGTGEDAVWFGQHDHTVHATDISNGMREKLVEKVRIEKLELKVTSELCSFTALQNLKNKGPYDMIFSNFGGLNCTDNLDKVLHSLAPLLKAGGIVTLVILPGFCLWETLLLFKGKFKTAFRRLFSRRGVRAHIEGEYFTCWYYNPSYVTSNMKGLYETLSVEGLCTLVPPSYFENFPQKRPSLFSWLKKSEDKWKHSWPWRSMGDYYIISLKKKL